jgi:hypothetical protein
MPAFARCIGIDCLDAQTPSASLKGLCVYLAEGDIDGQRIWLRIVKAVEELQRPKPAPGEAVN